MKFLDFFSGIGTIRIGMEQAGHECVGHVEWDKYAQASYMAMHDVKESEFIGWDIRGVRADELPRANAWWFGAPCQDFSIAGKRKGLEGDRSSLVREIFRLVRETEETDRPEWLLYENVKGMLSSNGGRDFLGILLEMDELGYDIEWQVLNSKNFGVPQNRERVFTIGHLRGRGKREILPIRGTDEQADIQIRQIGQLNTDTRQNSNRYRVYDSGGVAPCLGTMEGGGLQPCVGINVVGKANPKRATSANVYGIDGIMGVVCARDYKQPKTIAIREATSKGYGIAEPGDSINLEQPNSKTRRGRVGKGIANTLTTSCNQAAFTPTDLRIRKLTPKECFRLQGIPDEYFDKAQAVNSDSQLYKQAGNACTVNVIYEIAKRLEVRNGTL